MVAAVADVHRHDVHAVPVVQQRQRAGHPGVLQGGRHHPVAGAPVDRAEGQVDPLGRRVGQRHQVDVGAEDRGDDGARLVHPGQQLLVGVGRRPADRRDRDRRSPAWRPPPPPGAGPRRPRVRGRSPPASPGAPPAGTRPWPARTRRRPGRCRTEAWGRSSGPYDTEQCPAPTRDPSSSRPPTGLPRTSVARRCACSTCAGARTAPGGSSSPRGTSRVPCTSTGATRSPITRPPTGRSTSRRRTRWRRPSPGPGSATARPSSCTTTRPASTRRGPGGASRSTGSTPCGSSTAGSRRGRNPVGRSRTPRPSHLAGGFTPRAQMRLRLMASDAKSLVGSPGALFLDARTRAEYRGFAGSGKRLGHIPGAINLPVARHDRAGHRPVRRRRRPARRSWPVPACRATGASCATTGPAWEPRSWPSSWP